MLLCHCKNPYTTPQAFVTVFVWAVVDVDEVIRIQAMAYDAL